MSRVDWSPEVDARMRKRVVALLETHRLEHWHELMTVLHPRVVAFAEVALRRAAGGVSAKSKIDEQALDVALIVCADLRKHGFRRLAAFQGLHAESGAPLRGYMAKITRQTAFRYLRTQVLRPDGGRRAIISEARSAGPATLDRLDAARGPDTGTHVARHIAAREAELGLLSTEQREILELYLGGHTADEIAALRGDGLDAAEARQIIRSAKAKLKYHFGLEERER